MEELNLEEVMKVETKELTKIFVGNVEPLVQVLKAHLYTENFLEKVILSALERGDKLVENGSFSYHQKLLICEATDILPDSLISSLRNLNKLRNKFAHQLDMNIAESDVLRIGSPLGKTFTQLRFQHANNQNLLFSSVLVAICVKLSARCYELEHDVGVRA
ncbi:hypothetical protein [Alteromonas sp. a30]|uniref:hypothetical protein n=1 Tax=Alteromonas sp. a30 TaxID=2730917 RepID=UPI00227FB093|nr:hypothetical protein [Alteromonas sp. a30]MCY7297509.1 hypothetical protein [Alteromonas sp. a30]